MTKYTCANDEDPNDQFDLESTTELAALYEALESLGWMLLTEI